MKRTDVLIALACGLAWAATPCRALINPRFTPINLVEQASAIVVLKPAAPDDKGELAARVVKTLKGKAPADRIAVDLLAEWIKPIAADIAAAGDEPALLFVGAGEENQDAVYLHLAGRWIQLEAQRDGTYSMIAVDVEMRGTWAGGSDMLERAVEYILADRSPDMPVAVGCTWAQRPVLGKIAGPVRAAQAIDLAGDGRLALFLAADTGDRVYRYDPGQKEFADATASLKLASKSRTAVWADFNGDGRADLASWDGQALTLWLQSADGTFPAAAAAGADLPDGCLALAALDAGVAGRAGLLVSTARGPVLLAPQKEGAFKAAPLDGGADRAALGQPGACLLADFDGDGVADVLEAFAESGLFYKGKGAGAFAPAARCGVAAGKGRCVAWAGDFDADGRLDIFMSGPDACRLWQNLGELKFQETFAASGETAYIVQPKAVCGQTCDINNDGRQDLLVGYAKGIPLIFFNRGFRSFGKALEITEDNIIPEAEPGVQAAVVEDFTGDGAQDLAAVLTTGEVRVFVRSADNPDLCAAVRAALPMGKGPVGPATVTGWAGTRCLGAWSVTAGSPGALIARGRAGKITVKWSMPGGNSKPQQQEVTAADKPVRLELVAP
ncbi:MAG: hypothetical protein BIFFINMI_01440 [Phycisphaerae bacterium]|nr:hypothetical protein [Phycisphaerae bacterium]